jgi:glucose-1-phosphate cytidylyltransferase
MLARLAKEKELSLFKHPGFWFAVDTNKELEELTRIWNLGNPPWKVWE